MKMKTLLTIVCAITGALCLAIAPTRLSATVSAQETPAENVVFSRDNYYTLETVLDEMPKSFETWIQLSPSQLTAGGTIFGNIDANVHVAGSYASLSTNAISLEIDAKGRPKLYHKDNNGDLTTVIFGKVDVRSENFVHLAVTVDNGTAYCYLNGELKDRAEFQTQEFLSSYCFAVGNDYREKRDNYFKGQIKSLAVYADGRTAEEIAKAKLAVDVEDEDLIVAYDLEGKNGAEHIEDLSKNDNDLTRKWLFADAIEGQDDCEYSMMILGDTQALCYFRQGQDTPEGENGSYNDLYDYIVENAQSQKVVHVAQLGDLTQEAGTGTAKDEWTYVKNNYEKMNNLYENTGITYSVLAGNHEYHGGGITGYHETFGGSENPYAKQYFSSSNPETALCTAHKFSVGQLNYLFISISWMATQEDIAWADELIANHPYHNVIIATHAFRNVRGAQSNLYKETNSTYVNDGDYNWITGNIQGTLDENNEIDGLEDLVKRYPNVVLTLNGHHPTTAIENFVSYGEHGNKITHLVIDPTYFEGEHATATVPHFSEGAGMIAYLRFFDGGRRLGVSWYSAVKEQYYNSDSVYTLDIPVVEGRKVNVNVIGDGGTATVSQSETLNEPVRVNFNPESNYKIAKVMLDGLDVTKNVINNVYTIEQTQGYFNVAVEFTKKAYALSLENDDKKGNVVYDTGNALLTEGQEITVMITPNSGWKIANVTLNGNVLTANENGTYTIVKTAITDLLNVEYEQVNVAAIVEEIETTSPPIVVTEKESVVGTVVLAMTISFIVSLGVGIAIFIGHKSKD